MVTADPQVAVADPAEGLIPAQRIEIPLAASDEFEATGSQVTQTRATGEVRFTSTNTFLEVTVPEGTTVTTGEGVAFTTTAALVLPRASFETGPSEGDVPIRASRPGPAGNVGAGTITGAPQSLTAALVTVNNPEPTSGGRRVRTSVVSRADYDAAVEELTDRLGDSLEQALGDPAMTPRGLTLYPETATRGRPTAAPPPGDLVETRAERFSVTVEATATVLAVDETQLSAVAVRRLEETVPRDYRLFEDSVTTQVGEGRVEDGRIVYEVEAQAERWKPLDRQGLLAAVKGKSIGEARQILEPLGQVEIRSWPEFIDTIPSQEGRISMSILDPQRSTP